MKSLGKIVYSPQSHLGINKNWVVLMGDDNISLYYRKLYEMEYPYLNGRFSSKLTRPIWGSHCSFIRNEFISDKLWGTDNNKIIEFDYFDGVKTNGTYFWLRVECPYLLNLRERLGLCRNPKLDLHLTIGILSQ